jgi:hypothetical protein
MLGKSSFEDVEASYRRGYEQGARAALIAARVQSKELEAWLQELHTWRLESQRAGTKNTRIAPPEPSVTA